MDLTLCKSSPTGVPAYRPRKVIRTTPWCLSTVSGKIHHRRPNLTLSHIDHIVIAKSTRSDLIRAAALPDKQMLTASCIEKIPAKSQCLSQLRFSCLNSRIVRSSSLSHSDGMTGAGNWNVATGVWNDGRLARWSCLASDWNDGRSGTLKPCSHCS